MVRYRVLISGRVQGVLFRDSCRRLAERHGVAGWARNLPDGRVEAVFEGLAEDVRGLLDWAHTGPRLAVVESVAVHPEPPRDSLPSTSSSPRSPRQVAPARTAWPRSQRPGRRLHPFSPGSTSFTTRSAAAP